MGTQKWLPHERPANSNFGCSLCPLVFSSKSELTAHKKKCEKLSILDKQFELTDRRNYKEHLPDVERAEIKGLWSGKFREAHIAPYGVPKNFHNEARPYVKVSLFKDPL